MPLDLTVGQEIQEQLDPEVNDDAKEVKRCVFLNHTIFHFVACPVNIFTLVMGSVDL